jgi:hypothetical protein
MTTAGAPNDSDVQISALRHPSEYIVVQLANSTTFLDPDTDQGKAWISVTSRLNNRDLSGFEWAGWTQVRERPQELWLIIGAIQ